MNWTRLIARNSKIIKLIYPNCVWNIPNDSKKVYLTFDDGPTPEITNWVLLELKKHQAKATFFCIGANIAKYPELFKAVLLEGHCVGNHTFNHLNGWKTKNETYTENIDLCQSQISNFKFPTSTLIPQVSNLFRPPYGKIKRTQTNVLVKLGYKIIMWDVISQDYNSSITPENCLKNVIENLSSGSIIVFHDSEKAFKNLKYVLPKTLEFLKEKGYRCELL